jgi:hypothetical protein
VLEPEVHALVNLTRFLKIGLGATYRITDGLSFDGFTDRDLSGPSASILVMFGAN